MSGHRRLRLQHESVYGYHALWSQCRVTQHDLRSTLEPQIYLNLAAPTPGCLAKYDRLQRCHIIGAVLGNTKLLLQFSPRARYSLILIKGG
jgi:hypothetical protein